MKELEKIINYKFKNKDLLKIALTHSSYANENRCESYERLEFLGDSILSVIISEYLFCKMKNTQEGELSKIRASLVCEESLSAIAKNNNFGDFVLLGNGEEKAGSRNRNSILCDIFEAILAAIYLDSDIDEAKKYILRIMNDTLNKNLSDSIKKDYKSAYQEKIQNKYHDTKKITYSVVSETGPEHKKNFVVKLCVAGKEVSLGNGFSKKEAEQEAAKKALQIINDEAL